MDMTGNGPLLVVGLGEALFDMLPGGPALGGAPLNAAVHTHQLLQSRGRGAVVTRCGADELGRRLLGELRAWDLDAGGVQVDPVRATGRALVEMVAGDPHFEIVADAAWDALAFDADRAGRCAAVCFGTLGQRSEPARRAIRQFLDAAPQALRLFDVNLRQHYFDADTLRRSCERATIAKLNEKELPVVAPLLGIASGPAAAMIAEVRRAYALRAVVLTRGARGTLLATSDGLVEGESVSYAPADHADAVGAGDACSAGVIVGFLLGWPANRIVSLANRVGAFVASQPGATPRLPDEILQWVS